MIRYLNLSLIPQYLIDILPLDYSLYKKKQLPPEFLAETGPDAHRVARLFTYSFNKEINIWCQNNICDSMYYGFLLTDGDLASHVEREQDGQAGTKLNYVIHAGGSNVMTNFTGLDGLQKPTSFNIEERRWHVFKSDSYHSVTGITPGQWRLSVTASVFQ